jgi:hypothetical protein
LINVAINSSKTDQCGQKKLANSKNIEKKPFAQHRIIFEDAL